MNFDSFAKGDASIAHQNFYPDSHPPCPREIQNLQNQNNTNKPKGQEDKNKKKQGRT